MATWQHLRSSTANKRPTTSLADGRIAINTNTASPGLFFKDSAGTGIVKVGPVHVGTTAPNSVPAAGGSSGNYTGEQWLDTSVSPAQMKVWNGSTWVGIVADELPVSKLQDGAARQLIQTDAAGTGVEWTSDVDVPGTLDVTSTATFDSIAQHPLGTAGAPTITFTGDNNTGIYSPGADQVAISTNGSGRLFVDASGNVNVKKTAAGLSTVGFTAYDTGRVDVTANGAAPLFINRLTSNGELISFYKDTVSQGGIKVSGSDFEYAAYNSGALLFTTNSTERLRITSAGLVGVGTSSPGAKLEVVGGNIRLDNNQGVEWAGSNNYIYGNESTDFIAIATNGNERLRIDSSGRLGIGTSSPQSVLNISAASGGDTSGLRITRTDAGGGDWRIWSSATANGEGAGKLIFGNSANRVTIDGSGNVGIGTTSPGAPLEVIGTTGTISARANTGVSSQAIQIYNDGTNSYIDSTAYGAGSGGGLVFRRNGSGEMGRWDTSGRLLVGTSDGSGGVSKLVVQGASNGSAVGVAQISYNGLASAGLGAGTDIGYLRFTDQGSNSGVFAQITATADATSGANDYPGRLVFSVTQDGSASPTEAMRIENNGSMRVSGTLYRSGSCGLRFSGTDLIPQNGSGASVDNAVNLGASIWRWATVYAGTGTINTSDANLKQDIESLNQAELNAATAIKGLIKKFRFTDAVANKGDDARIHVGVIAQEIEQAFVDEGLDPRRYGMFCEDTLEDGSKSLGIRYGELLAFVIAAL